MLSEIDFIHHIEVIIGLTGAILASAYSAYHSKKARNNTDTINDAVNHRHQRTDKHGNLPPKLYDAVLHLHEKTDSINEKTDEILIWKKGYDGGPLDAGHKVEAFVDKVDKITEKLNKLDTRCPDCPDCDHKES